MFESPRPRTAASPLPPSPSSTSRATAHLQVVLARQRLAHAEAALQTAVDLEEGDSGVNASREQMLVGAAARVRAVLRARNADVLRHAIHEWRASADLVDIVGTAEEAIEVAIAEQRRLKQKQRQSASSAALVPHPPPKGGLLDAVLARLEPAALQWALSSWSRAAASLGRAASATALIEGKWALQKAAALDAAHREQIVRGVLRYWQQADLSRGWAQWLQLMVREPSHVVVSLA